ncbi:hypothetical protein [Paenibacillus sp. UNC451MF]|uniref:hypothetical protein n=1 Tax=Paenibacillus sp. UNC451MF TaxID=1449063 RepID=UPI0012DCAC28|nr:hypothetical protein [Paenibacillus sp. UNC451MF]
MNGLIAVLVFIMAGSGWGGEEVNWGRQTAVQLGPAAQPPINIERIVPTERQREFTEELTYSIESEQDSRLSEAFRLSYPNGITMPKRILVNNPYRLKIIFSEEVDRSSVEELLGKQLQNAEWSMEWEDGKTIQLVLNFPESAAAEDNYTILHLSGVQSLKGHVLKGDEHVVLQAVQSVEVKAWNSLNEETSTLYLGKDDTQTLSFSPDRQWLLRGERVENPIAAEEIYELMNREGHVIHSFPYGQIGYPQWLNDGQSLIYMKDTWKRQEVWLYNALTGEDQLFWMLPKSDELNYQRIAGIAVDPSTGQIGIAAAYLRDDERFSLDLLLFDSAEYTEPTAAYTGISRYRCLEGPCSAWIEFIGKGQLYYTTVESEAWSALPEVYILDTSTGERKRMDRLETAQWGESRVVISDRDHGVYVRMTGREEGKETIVVYDSRSGERHEIESAVELLAHSLEGFHLQEDGRIVFYAKGLTWFVIDLHKQTIEPYQGETLPTPMKDEDLKLYGSQDGIVVYGITKNNHP